MQSFRTTRLSLESLDDRTLPSATVFNLTAPGAEVVAGGFIARQASTRPAAEFTEFVPLNGLLGEQGYNTTASQTQFSEVRDGSFSPALCVSQVPTVLVGGPAYREFVLNANQLFLLPKLSVDQVKVFVGGSSDLTGYSASSGTLAGLRPVFDLDANGDVSLMVKAQQANGRFGTMTLLVPDAAFDGADPNDFVYLYSKMGEQLGGLVTGGAESWAVHPASDTPLSPPPAPPAPPPPAPPPPVAPPPATSTLSGTVFVDSDGSGVKDDFEAFLAGVTIQLTGQNDLGEWIELTTTTDENGFYTFENLSAGVYSISEVQPWSGNNMDLDDGEDYAGSLGGDTGDDLFTNIYLGTDQYGTDYNFTERYHE